jgi:hypothetical protein
MGDIDRIWNALGGDRPIADVVLDVLLAFGFGGMLLTIAVALLVIGEELA